MKLITEKELFNLYITQNMRRKEVAEYFGCSDSNIKIYLRKYNIQKPFELECKNKERKITVKCLYCGNNYITQLFRIESDVYDSKYCSHSCAQKSRYLGEDHKRKIRNEIAARRRARMKKQSPELTEHENKRIKEIYLNCSKGYEVDHIIPISKGGLHHPDNLQILTMEENRKKWCNII